MQSRHGDEQNYIPAAGSEAQTAELQTPGIQQIMTSRDFRAHRVSAHAPAHTRENIFTVKEVVRSLPVCCLDQILMSMPLPPP